MDDSWFGLIELLLVGAACLGFGFQQLWSLRRDRLRRERAGPEAQTRPRDQAE